MTHSDNSRVERINLTMTNSLKDFFNLISDSDKKSPFCQTELVRDFLYYGLNFAISQFSSFREGNIREIRKDLKHIKMNGSEDSYFVHFKLREVIGNIKVEKKLKGGEKENAEKL